MKNNYLNQYDKFQVEKIMVHELRKFSKAPDVTGIRDGRRRKLWFWIFGK